MSKPVPHYHIDLFYSEEDECWIANVPDLRFCSAHGETAEAAAREIQIAMEAWIESWMKRFDSPPPLRYRPQLAEAG